MTTIKSPEQEANELVEMFALQLFMYPGMTDYKVVNIAILHVERLIEAFDLIDDAPHAFIPSQFYYHYEQVLQILKDKK